MEFKATGNEKVQPVKSEKLKVGDVVRLKSGGPKMTVRWVNENADKCMCNWFPEHGDQTGHLQASEFNVATLKSVSP